MRIFAGFLGGTSNESEVVGDGNFCRFECTATSSETSDIRLTILYGDRPTCIVSYRIVMYISEVHASSKTPAPRPKQTGKFLTVLRMFPPTVSSHECWVADCSRCEGRRRQMICRPVQWAVQYPLLSQERIKLRTSNLADIFRGSIRTKAL